MSAVSYQYLRSTWERGVGICQHYLIHTFTVGLEISDFGAGLHQGAAVHGIAGQGYQSTAEASKGEDGLYATRCV